MKAKFLWPSVNKDVGAWAKTCISCQKAKVQEGYSYLITIIDRATGWPEAIPETDITAKMIRVIILP